MLIVLFIFISGVWIFSYKREHILSILLRLEYIIITLFLLMGLGLAKYELFYSLLFLTFTACEGALGLSILVIISRTHGGDYLKSFNIILN